MRESEQSRELPKKARTTPETDIANREHSTVSVSFCDGHCYPEANGKWAFRVDPRSPLHIYFLDLDGQWHALRWTHAPDFLQPFADITAAYVKRQLRGAGLNPADQDEVARALISLQNRADADEITTATNRRTLLRGRARTRSALKDQQRAHTVDITEKTIQAVPEPEADDHEIDFDNIQPFDVCDGPNISYWLGRV